MGLWSRLNEIAHRPSAGVPVGQPRARRRDSAREGELRAVLATDPNDEAAFRELAAIVAARAAAAPAEIDPLIAEAEDAPRLAADLAVWALAEEFAGSPRGWYPLVELGRLSLTDDPEGAMRRLATAADREPTGRALVESLKALRAAGMPAEALGLGTGHWRAREHDPQVGVQLVHAALEIGRPEEARLLLGALGQHPDAEKLAESRSELARRIDEAEQTAGGAR